MAELADRIRAPFSLESRRLVLTSPTPGEEPAIREAIAESFASLHEWLPWARTMPTLKEIAQANAGLRAKFDANTEFHFRIRRQTDGRYLGSIGLLYVDPEVPSLELGFWLRETARRQGYMSEALQTVARFARQRLGAQRLQMRIDPRNMPSCALAEQLGFVREGLCESAARDNQGQLAAHALYALVSFQSFRP